MVSKLGRLSANGAGASPATPRTEGSIEELIDLRRAPRGEAVLGSSSWFSFRNLRSGEHGNGQVLAMGVTSSCGLVHAATQLALNRVRRHGRVDC